VNNPDNSQLVNTMCHIVSGIDADITHETAACTVARLYVGVLSEAPTAIVSGF